MKKDRWIEELSIALGSMDENEKEEIINDYIEYFYDALESGRSEEEITESLGNPKKIAKELKADYFIKETKKNMTFKNSIRGIFAILTLSFFNLTIMIGPIIAILAIIFAVIVTGIALSGAGIICFFVGVTLLLGVPLLVLTTPPFVAIVTGLLLFSLGGMFIIFAIVLSKMTFKVFSKYIKLNINFVKGGKRWRSYF